MDKRKSPKTSVVEPVSKPSSEEMFKFIDCFQQRQWPEIWRQVQKGHLSPSVFQAIIEHRNPFEVLTNYEQMLRWHSGWPRFWRAFDFDYYHDELVLPGYRAGFGWSIVTPELTERSTGWLLAKVCQRMFAVQADRHLDFGGIVSEQQPTGTHVVLVRDRIEADEEYKGTSADVIAERGILAITLRQRLVLGARYYFETGQHLDPHTATICAGSYWDSLDGETLLVRDDRGSLEIENVDPDRSSDYWRVREVIYS